MKIRTLIILMAVITCCVILTSCNDKQPSQSDFEFFVATPVLETNCGETVTYNAELKNKTENEQ